MKLFTDQQVSIFLCTLLCVFMFVGIEAGFAYILGGVVGVGLSALVNYISKKNQSAA